MCGRYTLTHLEKLTDPKRFQVTIVPFGLKPRFNIAPTQEAPVVLDAAPDTITMARWGLIPTWAKDATMGYRMINARAEMGAKLGLHVQINSKACADLSLLEIGDNVVIGGHATVIAHSFESRGLILKRVRIDRNAIIGLNAIVLPGVHIGERAVIGAGVFVPKETTIDPGTVYLGAASRRHD